MNIKIKWTVCRICLNNVPGDSLNTSIFEKDDFGIEILQKISDCSGIEIKRDDNLPDKICSKCNAYLSVAYKFRTRCITSDKSLREFETATLKAQNDILSDPIENNEESDKEIYLQPPEFVDVLSESDKSNKKSSKCESEEDSVSKQSLEELEVPSSDEDFNEKNIDHKKATDVKVKSKNKSTSPYICHICGNQFSQKSRLTGHVRQHIKEKPFECEICKKSFGYNFLLTRHMRIHTGQKPYQCKYCHRKFSDQTDKVKHERIHTNERPYTCNICGKTFRLSQILSVHKMIHTGEKPYKCTLCGKKFTQRHKLKSHLLTQRHKNDLNKPEMAQMMENFS